MKIRTRDGARRISQLHAVSLSGENDAPMKDATSPADIIGAAAIAALRAAGWIIVREDAIRLAQAHAREEVRK